MSNINDIKYTYFDFLQKRYDIAKKTYENLLENINDLWEQVMQPYLEDDTRLGNGFLQKLRDNFVKGQREFYKFMLEKSIPAKLVQQEYYQASYFLNKYVKEHPNDLMEESLYYADKMDNCVEIIKQNHIDLFKQVYGNEWDFEKEKIVEDVYNCFFD